MEELVIISSPPQAPKNLSPPHSALEVVENLRAQRVETAKAARRSGMVSIRRQREAECRQSSVGTASESKSRALRWPACGRGSACGTSMMYSTMPKPSSVTRAARGSPGPIMAAASPKSASLIIDELVDDLRMHSGRWDRVRGWVSRWYG